MGLLGRSDQYCSEWSLHSHCCSDELSQFSRLVADNTHNESKVHKIHIKVYQGVTNLEGLASSSVALHSKRNVHRYTLVAFWGQSRELM